MDVEQATYRGMDGGRDALNCGVRRTNGGTFPVLVAKTTCAIVNEQRTGTLNVSEAVNNGRSTCTITNDAVIERPNILTAARLTRQGPTL